MLWAPKHTPLWGTVSVALKKARFLLLLLLISLQVVRHFLWLFKFSQNYIFLAPADVASAWYGNFLSVPKGKKKLNSLKKVESTSKSRQNPNQVGCELHY